MGFSFSVLLVSHILVWTHLLVDLCSGLHAESIMSLNLPITSESVSDDEKAEQLGQSCDFKIHCPWVSSTKRDGTPHWVQSIIGELEPEKQRELFENQSSPRHKQDEILFLNTSRSLETCEVTWLLSPVLTGSSEMCQLELILYSQEDAQITAMVHNIKANLSLPLSLKEMTVNKRSNWKMLSSETTGVNEPFRISLDYTHCDRAADHFIVLESLTLKHCSAAGYQDSDVPTCIGETSFFCDNGDCMSHVKLCDFNWDCPTGEDEGALCEIILPPGSYCSFEDGTCGWTSYEGSDARWLFTDSAQMEDTSPTDLKFVKGHFLYLSVQSKYSDGNATTYSAMIPVVAPENDCQLRFKFLISGIYNGSLGIYGLEEEKEFESSVKLWVKEGPLGDFWNSGTLQIPQFQNRFRLLVVAVWGWNTHAHIALDNVTFSADCFHAGRIEIGYENRGSMDDFEDTVTPLSEPFYTDENSELELQFTACGASGPHGPTQTQCDNAYRNSNISVVVGKDGPLRGLQMWKVPFTSTYQISAYGAAGGKGAKNHNNPAHGVFISAIFPLHKDETLFILVGQQGEDACPGKNELTREICTGKSSVIEDNYDDQKKFSEWAGGGGGGGGASYVFKEVNGEFIPLLVAAGGGGKAYLEDTEDPLDLTQPERFENNTAVPGLNGMSAAAGGGGGWNEITDLPVAGKSLVFGAEGGQSCYKAIIKLQWHTAGGFGGGGGPCTSGGGGGGYQGGNASELDEIFSDGQYGVSFFHPSVKIFLHPLAAMEGHGEVQIKLFVNCSHCHTDNCKRDAISRNVVCLCDIGTVLASDNITCIVPKWAIAEKQLPLSLIFAVLIATVILGVIFACGSLSFVYHRKKKQLEGARVRLQSTEYKLSKIRSSIIMTDYNPNYCFAGKGAGLSELKEVPRKNITLLRALGHGAFGEVYEGMVVGISGDPNPLQVAIKTLPEICSEQDEMDFLMEALIISKFSHQNIVRCIGVSLQTLPRFILLELMSGGDMKSFLRHNRPWLNKPSTLSMLDLLNMARDIACGCKYLEDNHFIHRDIAARNCLLMYSGTGRVAKIGDFGMARDIYRASYYRKGGRAMLPVKWMPPEAFLEGVFTSKTDTWSFGVLLWEIFSLGYMPYPCKTNQEVLEFVTSGGRMDPPKNCPGPVYRIMTQCWQHTPGHRPNFSTILERISYCTQDPDVINTPLPIESGPAPEDEGSTSIRPNSCNGINPMMSSPPLAPLLDTQSIEQKLGDAPQELLVENLAGWNIKTPGLQTVAESTEGSWFQSNLNSTTEPNPQTTHKLKNKSKNLWNPTYGSWVMESTC